VNPDVINKLAFEFSALDSNGVEINSFGVPGGIVYDCCIFAEEYGFPMITSIYNDGFYEGIEWKGKEVEMLKEECAKLTEILETFYLRLSREEKDISKCPSSNLLLGWIGKAAELAHQNNGSIDIC